MSFRFKKVVTIKSTSSTIDLNRIMSNLRMNVDEIGVMTDISGDTLNFKRINKSYLQYGDSRLHYLKIIRKGNFRLINKTKVSVDLVCEVDLDTLIFESAVFGLMFGYLSYVFICRDFTVLLIGLISWLTIFLIGYIWISIEMNSIIENSGG
jgi:hypothetical protein